MSTGDFHQFPPVANSSGGLYCAKLNFASVRAAIGQEAYLQLDTVVIMREQIRVHDKTWTEILRRLREGCYTDEDLHDVRKVLTNDECEVPDFTSQRWSDAIFITPRYAVRERWNQNPHPAFRAYFLYFLAIGFAGGTTYSIDELCKRRHCTIGLLYSVGAVKAI